MNPIPIDTEDSPSFLMELIYRLRIRDVMTEKVITVKRGTPLRSVQAIMKENGITGVPVAEDGRLLGMISVDDILQALDEGHIDDRVEERMARNLIVLEEDMPLSFGISYFDKYRYGRFPILDRNKHLVGIITSRDILVALLMEFNKEVEKLESRIPPDTSTTPSSGTSREFAVRKFDFENAGKASFEIKKICKEHIANSKAVRRVAVAAYELEMNLVVHSNGGKIFFSLSGDTAVIETVDTGPGIEDVDQAVEEGYTTATEWVRSLGFGAGMGLPNTKRVSDDFAIESSPGGTRVCATIRFDKGDQT
ncbi:MAG: CBS domain-containing protein [Spirochaetaceae bacterium]|nr:MAG: CBS domain-containing protein [Spirochaetaceae bacterium]